MTGVTLTDFREDLSTDLWLVEEQRPSPGLTLRLLGEEENITYAHTRRSVLNNYVLPLTLAAFFNGPARLLAVRRAYQPSPQTPITAMAWHLNEEFWNPEPQLITNAQVRALNALLATPYTNSHDFEYFADE